MYFLRKKSNNVSIEPYIFNSGLFTVNFGQQKCILLFYLLGFNFERSNAYINGKDDFDKKKCIISSNRKMYKITFSHYFISISRHRSHLQKHSKIL